MTFILYFLLNKNKLTELSKSFLVVASLFFYSWWNPSYLPLILISMCFNYSVGRQMGKLRSSEKTKCILLSSAISINLLVLGYFKYVDFFIENTNLLFTTNIALLKVALPLAISFFTFQQIAYLVDASRGEMREYDFLNYALFVSFFPQLIAGPIVHHKEMMPQFAKLKNKVINYDNIAKGLFIFSLGLFKKVVIADTFSVWVNEGYSHIEQLNMIEAWFTSLSYTTQLYFDFSGYCDMAMGSALFFNIKLPLNFNSPYKALNIQQFWRSWHMTLSRFLKDYIYIPLGGNRGGTMKLYRNLLITFILGGIWHGAGWTFIIWGALHGFALIAHRISARFNIKVNKVLAWFITFNFINFTWVFFRANDLSTAINLLKGMFGSNGLVLYDKLETPLSFLTRLGIKFQDVFVYIDAKSQSIAMLTFVILTCALANNSNQLMENMKLNKRTAFITSILFVLSLLHFSRVSEFIYFNF